MPLKRNDGVVSARVGASSGRGAAARAAWSSGGKWRSVFSSQSPARSMGPAAKFRPFTPASPSGAWMRMAMVCRPGVIASAGMR